jgi:4-hydroxy-3-methylbut-2-enyl diphosphate reductase
MNNVATLLKDAEILLANPRGFCAGVDRAIDIVELALLKFGAPIYVRHEIVQHLRGGGFKGQRRYFY